MTIEEYGDLLDMINIDTGNDLIDWLTVYGQVGKEIATEEIMRSVWYERPYVTNFPVETDPDDENAIDQDYYIILLQTFIRIAKQQMFYRSKKEEIKIYRGTTTMEADSGQYGYSWTTSLEQAQWFADRINVAYGDGRGIVLEATVDSDDIVLDLRDGYKENEVVTDNPKNVRSAMLDTQSVA